MIGKDGYKFKDKLELPHHVATNVLEAVEGVLSNRIEKLKK